MIKTRTDIHWFLGMKKEGSLRLREISTPPAVLEDAVAASASSATATTAARAAVRGLKRCSSEEAIKKPTTVRSKTSFTWSSSARKKRG